MAEVASVLHPADDLAFVRHELASCVSRQRILTVREEALTAALVGDHEARVGSLHHAVVTHVRGRDVVDVELLPDLQRVLLLLQGPVVVVDTETTGPHPLQGDRLITAAFLRVHPDAIAETPLEITVSAGASSSSRPAFAYTHARAIIDVCRGRTLVAYDAPLEVAFLDAEFEAVGLYYTGVPADVVDIHIVSQMLWPGETVSLDALATRLGVHNGDRDTALGDARLLAACLPGLRDALRRRIAR